MDAKTIRSIGMACLLALAGGCNDDLDVADVPDISVARAADMGGVSRDMSTTAPPWFGPMSQGCYVPHVDWLNPLPQGNTLHRVFARATDDVWAVGAEDVNAGPREPIMALWGAAPNDVPTRLL